MRKLLTIIVCIFLLTGCTVNFNKEKIEKEKTFLGNTQDENGDMVLYLNTETNITTVNSKYKEQLVTLAREKIDIYHKLLDSHHYYLNNNNDRIVNMMVLNENIDNGPIVVDSIIIEALKEAKTLATLTKGYFNFTIGKLSDLYHEKLLPFDSTNSDPSFDDISSALLGIIEYDKLDDYIIINETNSTIELKSKDNHQYKLDLGAFSKGYILNKVYEELIKYNSSFLLTAGSSSIVTYTNPNEEITWSVGIKNPNITYDQLLAFTINNGAVSTSGDYENYYFLEDGTRRHHILNPYTGFSENFYRSNTLISSNACVIDALSTALFNVEDANDRNIIISNIKNYYDIDIEYCFANKDDELTMSKGFSDILIDMYTSKQIKKINVD